MNFEQRRNLSRVATVLREQAVPELFHMRRYMWSGLNEKSGPAPEPAPVCGTPSCALGWYAWSRNWAPPFERVLSTRGVHPFTAGTWVRNAQSHFGLTAQETEHIFGPHGCGNAKTPIAAAQYIEAFLASRQGA